MELKFYNTLTRKVEEFKPIKKSEAGIYTCGPTVYWFQHIGNLRAYIFSDILKRVLMYNGYKVKHVMNYTDVGHLTSDADTGEDKMEKAAKKEGKTAKEIADYYAQIFEEDCKKLNIIKPDIVCRATDHIKEQIEMIKKLEAKGYTYKTDDGIYYDTSKFSDYAKLGRLSVEGLEAGKRIEMGEKRNKTDFALWKFSERKGERQQEWDPKDFGADWPTGFPGWHIECSAMSSKYLGDNFDIHTGGEDHIQVHHTNEIAQTEAAFGVKPWVKYWMHGAFLTFGGEKVSKSKGGLFTISELEEKGFDPIDYRYFCLGTLYRKQLAFSIEALEGAKNSFERLKNIVLDLKSENKLNTNAVFESKYAANERKNESINVHKKYKEEFLNAVNDDLNIPIALAVMWNLVRDEEVGNKEKLDLIYDFDSVFSLGLKNLKEIKTVVPQKIKKLIAEREKARKEQDWQEADKIRKEIGDLGYIIEDSKEGVNVKKK